jgi:hypothetical protein
MGRIRVHPLLNKETSVHGRQSPYCCTLGVGTERRVSNGYERHDRVKVLTSTSPC